MAQREIEQWAKILQEAEAEDRAYESACQKAMKEAEEATSYENVELDAEDEIIDPASLGFVNSEEDVVENDLLDGGFHNGHEDVDECDEVDFNECGFTEDGKPLQEKEAEDDLNEDLHRDDEFASIELDIFDNEDGTGKAFAEELKSECPNVFARPANKVGPNPVWKLTGTVKDLKEAYAFWLGLFNWKDVEDQGEADGFYNSIKYEDGDTIQEADYREALAHVFDPVGVRASTANLKKTNTCELSIVKEAVQAEIQKRKMKKALLEKDFGSLSDEDLEKLDSVLTAKEEVDSGDADDEDERVWLAVLKTMGINSIEEYRAMPPEEFQKLWDKYNRPSNQANGFSRSNHSFVAYHPRDNENGGATRTEFAFNPDYYHRVTRAEEERLAKKADQAARQKATDDLLAGQEEALSFADMSPAEFGRFLHSLEPKKVRELRKAMLDAAHEDNADNPAEEAREIMFINRIFGKDKATFRDIARLWYPGEDPNTRQQSVNKFAQDMIASFYQATRQATGSDDGGLETFRKKVLGNEATFRKFLEIIKQQSDKKKANKRSIVNKKGADTFDDAANDDTDADSTAEDSTDLGD